MAKKKNKKKRSKSRSSSIEDDITAPANDAKHDNGHNNVNISSPKLKPKSSQQSLQQSPKRSPTKIENDEKHPIEEDLSLQRHDEEMVLQAIYGNDFKLETGAWNCPLYKLRIRPASDVTDQRGLHTATNASSQREVSKPHNPSENEEGAKSCELTLHIQLNQKYPYSVPLMQITDAVNVSNREISELLTQLQSRAKECANMGAVMGWELGQVVERLLVDCVERRKMEDIRRREDMTKKKKSVDFSYDVENIMNKDGDEYFNSQEDISSSSNDMEFKLVDNDTQREVARQIEALDAAARMRKQRRQRAMGGLPSIADEHGEDDEDADEDDNILQFPEGYDLDLPPEAVLTAHGGDLDQGGNNTSRYQTDFVELAHLGQGGGGEVVQAINRLDRRVYAIKKVLLEAETNDDPGNKVNNKWAAVQNEKLRREVTTISMMSHKNIVRYYQAWVESPGNDQVDEEESSHEKQENKDIGGINEIQSKENEDESSSWDSWSSDGSSGSSESSSQSEDDTQGQSRTKTMEQMTTTDYARSLSLDNFLEHEIDSPDFANPLLGNGTLFGYPPIATSSKSSHTQSHQNGPLQSQSSYSTSNWTGKEHSKDHGIMYIQMQYCKTTMKDMIDESKLTIDIVWKSLRQILEALVYIHSRNVIHRDLKPANIFIDDEENIRLGDFGLATSNRTATRPQGSEADGVPESEADALYEAIDDISGLLGGATSSVSNNPTVSMSSITGGVGTTFYMAPEQEQRTFSRSKIYDSKADIYSLGVLLFEMFMLEPLGSTYMERAEKLTALRGESRDGITQGMADEDAKALFTEEGEIIGDWELASKERFPESFRSSTPSNAQKIILWCLELSPKHRPSAKQLLTSELLPRKVELEEKYLNEVLQTLANPQSEHSRQQIFSKLFDRPTPTAVLTTYDSDVSIKANKLDAPHLLAKSLNAVKGSHWSRLSYSSPMSGVAVAAAVSSLGRARHVGTVSGGGKEGEALRGAPQQATTILAMTAASAAAVEGSADGILGADPRVVEALCCQICEIFQSHGAVRLQGPLLRPRDSNDPVTSLNRPVEVLARRGSVLRLREDLCANFARAVSRGGSATSNMKRYDINKVFIESDAGLHPKEMLEASFDIIQDENTAKPELLEAESIFVLCQIMELLAPKEEKIYDFPPIALKSPIWFLRLTHTRLSDAIMDLMFIPTCDAIRQSCLDIFTTLTACPPTELCNQRRQSGKHKRRAREVKSQKLEFLDKCLEAAVINDNLPKRSAKRLRSFLTHIIMPQLNANKVLDAVYEATKKIHHTDINSSNHNDEIKRLSKSCFGEAVRCINQLKQLLKAMETFGIVTSTRLSRNEPIHIGLQNKISNPAYISIDLGLRQKRNHFSGRVFFQAILLQDDFFDGDMGEANTNTIFSTKSTRVAEGGRYDDLVRQFRPPGNFGSARVDNYTSAKVPFCSGLILFIGKMIQRIYHDATCDEQWQGHSFVESIRRSMGHPLIDSLTPIKCVVTSESGLDLATCAERAKIASTLWRAGISCEYLAQSGVMLSLLRHLWSDSNSVHEWSSSVDRLCGVCVVLNIPFVIVVQQHLLRSKAAVKLRHITANTASGPIFKGTEELVPLSSLAANLLERLHSHYSEGRDDTNIADLPNQPINGELSNPQVQSHGNVEVECIYVGTDQYFDNEHRVNNAQYKQIKKVMKSSTQKMASHISDFIDQGNPVIALDLPFQVVRNIGSSLIFDGIESLNSSQITSKYPEHKKLLRNLMYALDALIRKNRSQSSSRSGKNELRLFLYSISCDKYDLVTLTIPS